MQSAVFCQFRSTDLSFSRKLSVFFFSCWNNPLNFRSLDQSEKVECQDRRVITHSLIYVKLSSLHARWFMICGSAEFWFVLARGYCQLVLFNNSPRILLDWVLTQFMKLMLKYIDYYYYISLTLWLITWVHQNLIYLYVALFEPRLFLRGPQ